MSQEDLARAVGVPAKTVDKWEAGKAYPNVEQLEQLARCFQTNFVELVAPDTGAMRASMHMGRKRTEALTAAIAACIVPTVIWLIYGAFTGIPFPAMLIFLAAISPIFLVLAVLILNARRKYRLVTYAEIINRFFDIVDSDEDNLLED